MKKSIGSLKALLMAVLVAVPMGCSSDAPTAPASPPPQASLLGGLLGTVTGVVSGVSEPLGGTVEGLTGVVGGVVNTLLDPLVCPTRDSYSATKTIGRNGGTLRVGPHTLVVPYGALPADTRITATAPRGSYAEVQFQPHGLKFERPVTLTISYEQCGLLRFSEPPVIVYADEKRNILEVLRSTIDRRRETITGKTDHFSSYILAER